MAGSTTNTLAAAHDLFYQAAVFVIVAFLFSVLLLAVSVSVSWLRRPRLPAPGTGPESAEPANPLRAFPVVGPTPAVALSAVPPPVAGDEPGVFRVVGVERESGADFVTAITAVSMANARVKAELKGVIVTSIARQEVAEPIENPIKA